MVKRPLGLKASKSTKKSKPINPTSNENQSTEEPNKSFTTIGFKSTKANEEGNEGDGLTISDLLELVIQSKQNLIRFYLLETDEFGNEASNLLRGICHECYRRISLKSSSSQDNANEDSGDEASIFSVLAWASFQLGLLLYPIGLSPREKFIQLDEPEDLKRWCWISSKSLESGPEHQNEPDSNHFSSQFSVLKPTLSLTQALLEPNTESVIESLENWSRKVEEEISKADLPDSQRLWSISSSLQTIEWISPNWDDSLPNSYGSQKLYNLIKKLLNLFIENLSKISETDDQKLVKVLQYSLVYHLAQRSLLHGSSLAENIEDEYFPEEEEEQAKEEEGFAIDVDDPVYQDTLSVLHLAEVSFVKAIEMVENDTLLKDTKEEIIKDWNDQLSETLLTLGNMLEPGEQQETVYKRASELSGVAI